MGLKGLTIISLNRFTPKSDLIDFTLTPGDLLVKGRPLGSEGVKITHEQTITSRFSFVGNVMGFRQMKRKETKCIEEVSKIK